jgi:o-succinylbenzoate synthase
MDYLLLTNMNLTATWTYRDLAFKVPSGTSRGVLTTKRSYFILIKDTHSGKIGYGECGVLASLSIDYLPAYEQCLRKLCANINDVTPDQFIAFPSIRFGLEMALLSLSQEDPFILFPSKFTTGESTMEINGLIWMGDFDYMSQQIKTKIEEGYSCIKLKIGAINFDQELKLIKQIRKEYSKNDIEIRVDANGGFNQENALHKLHQLSELQIHSIEQPIAQGQWNMMSKLCKESPLPIALDEELIGVHDANTQSELLDIIKPHYLIFKPSLLGGFAATNQWIKKCEARGIKWWITSALESNIGLSAITQFTYTLNNPLPQGLGTGQLYTNNITSPLEISKGRIAYRKKNPWKIDTLFSSNSMTLEDILNESSNASWIQDIQAFHENWYDTSKTIEVQTSGSTGKPKTISLPKKAMVSSAKNTIKHFGIPKNATALLCLPAQFIAGKMMIVRSIVGNWNLSVTKPTSAIEIPTQSLDFVAMTPHQVICTIKKYGAASFNNIKILIIGGGEIPINALEEITLLPCQVFSTYGMTETITHVATKNLQQANATFNTLPNIDISIDDRNCLVIATNYLAGKIITNDVVNIIDAESFEWIGRIDNVINSGGLKIQPELLEQTLGKYCSDLFFFHGADHEVLGQQLILVTDKQTNLAALTESILKNVPKHHHPKQLWIVEHMIKTPTDKINRKATLESVVEKREV